MKFRMVTEARDYWGPKIKSLRDYKNPDINAELDEMEKATNGKELHAAKANTIQKIKNQEKLNYESGFGRSLYSMESEVDDYYRYLIKQMDRKEIDARKAEKAGKKEALTAKIQKAFEHPLLNKALESVAKQFFKSIKDSIEETETDKVEKYFTKDKLNVKDPKHPSGFMYPNWRPGDKGYEEHERYWKLQNYLREYFDRKNRKEDALRPDWKEYIDKKATDYATLIVDRWKNKMAFKLGEVIDRKGGAKVESTSDNLLHHDLYFKFDDGAAFRVNTQQVWATSKLGNVFTRYPTTFHDVKFKDGTYMKKPSAEKMQDEFGISDFTISEKDK